MKYLRYSLAILAGFIVIFLGSIYIPGIVLPALYGPYPTDGNIPFIRTFTDFWLSFVFTMLGGYLSALMSPSKPIWSGLAAGVAYFSLSAYWYSGYGLVGRELVSAIFMLLKVPVAAFLGAFLYKKYNKTYQQDVSEKSSGLPL